jgi:hypothetical protein
MGRPGPNGVKDPMGVVGMDLDPLVLGRASRVLRDIPRGSWTTTV